MGKEIWDDFEIDLDNPIGRGGMGAVYRGRQISLGRPVAIKVLSGNLTAMEDFILRFQREARLLARLVDPNVVQIYGAGNHGKHHFYAMEFVDGVDLGTHIEKGRRFTMDEVIRVAEQVGSALHAAWKLQITHRDIKPSNILLNSDGEVKVTDFGLAKNPAFDLTRSDLIVGTPKYSSPEQATGEPCDVRSDIYSLGVALYELATGQAPFQGDSPTALMFKHVHEKPRPPMELNGDLPPGLDSVILRCLEKRPDDRFQTPEDFLRAVRNLGTGPPPRRDTPAARAGADAVASPAPAGTGDPDDLVDVSPVPRPAAPVARAESDAGGRGAPYTVLLVLGLLILAGAAVVGYQALQDAPKENGNSAAPPPPVEPDPPDTDEAKEMERKLISAALTEAEGHFAVSSWTKAIEKYDEALSRMAADHPARGPAERNRKIAGYRLDLEAGRHENVLRATEDIFGTESEEYRQARTRLREFRFGQAFAEGEAAEKKREWKGAADAYRRAQEFAGEKENRDLDRRIEFCQGVRRALDAESRNEWESALETYRDLLGMQRGHVDFLRRSVDYAEGRIRKEKRDREEKRHEEIRGLLKAIPEKYAMARWKSAMADAMRAKELGEDSVELREWIRKLEPAAAAPEGFTYVPAGDFLMGSDDGHPVESPSHTATTRAFYIGLEEVTQAAYAKFLASAESESHEKCDPAEPKGKSHVPDGWSSDLPAEGPVTGVDWFDAAAYARWSGGRLPTEAEWEKAAALDPKANASRKYPWGDVYNENAEDVSFLGCRGMGGGPLEWTQSELLPYPGASVKHSEFGRGRRVLRGGIVIREDAQDNARTAFRYWHRPGRRDANFGFRCVRDLKRRK